MFGSEIMQSDARGFDNEDICYSSHKVKKTGDIGIKYNGLDAPEFLEHDGFMVLHHHYLIGDPHNNREGHYVQFRAHFDVKLRPIVFLQSTVVMDERPHWIYHQIWRQFVKWMG